MKKSILLIFCMFFATLGFSQMRGVTEKGDEIFLYENGTWTYANELNLEEVKIPTNTTLFTKDEKSSFLVKSENLNIGIWLDPKVWSFKKATENLEAEYELVLKGEDLYGMLISEKVEIPLESLRNIALESGKSVSPDLKIVKEEYRNVNGLNVLLMQMDGTMQGIKFSYYGYYFSNANGTVQFITYTSQNLLKIYKDECDKLLNGMVIIE